MSSAATHLAIFSSWLDGKIDKRLRGMTADELRVELLLMHRTIKAVEEVGEAFEKLIGLTGANPRKGVAATEADLVDELLDVAVSALGAVEHITGNEGGALSLLTSKITGVHDRAGLGQERMNARTDARP